VSAPGRERLLELIERIDGLPVAVVGDLVLDRYWVGRSSRISREAPVLILDFEEERVVPGGAANAAMNVRSLGGRSRLVGRVGRDGSGTALAGALRSNGLSSRWVVRHAGASTIVKTRVLAGSRHASRQQIVRLDRGHRRPFTGAEERALAARLRSAVAGARALLLSDYGYGVLGPAVRRAALRAARARKIPVVVDSRYALRSYRGATLLTPNEHEVAEALHLPSLDARVLRRAGEELRRRAEAEAVWITRGSDGMMLFERRMTSRRIPIVGSSDVADVQEVEKAVGQDESFAELGRRVQQAGERRPFEDLRAAHRTALGTGCEWIAAVSSERSTVAVPRFITTTDAA